MLKSVKNPEAPKTYLLQNSVKNSLCHILMIPTTLTINQLYLPKTDDNNPRPTEKKRI